jgi:hypothetical protein
LARDRISGALELLLSTSLSLKELSSGIWMTVRRFMLGPALVILATGLVIFLFALNAIQTNWTQPNYRDNGEFNAAWMIFLGLSILFVVDLVAAVWTGLWMSCLTRLPNGAAGMALLRLLLLPWVLFFATISLMNYFGIRRFFDHFQNVFALWFVFCLVNNILWIRQSRKKFYEQVRVAASERFLPGSEKSWWKFWRKAESAGG